MGLSSSGGLVSSSGGLHHFCMTKGLHFASIKLCQASVSDNGSVVRCHSLVYIAAELFGPNSQNFLEQFLDLKANIKFQSTWLVLSYVTSRKTTGGKASAKSANVNSIIKKAALKL